MIYDAFDGAAVVEQYWPYDGPHTPDTVREAAAAMAALVRYLNNATGAGHGEQTLSRAPRVDRVLGDVTVAVSGFEQLLTQLGDATARHAIDDTLYDDRHNRPGYETADDLADVLHDARIQAVNLYRVLTSARAHSYHLGHHTDDSEQDTES